MVKCEFFNKISLHLNYLYYYGAAMKTLTMKILAPKLKISLFSSFCVSALSLDSFASTYSKKVHFAPTYHTVEKDPRFVSAEEMQRLRDDFNARMEISMPNGEYYGLMQKIRGILEPGDPWNFEVLSSQTLLPYEDIRQRSIEAWQDYTLERCIRKLNHVRDGFAYFSSIQELLPDVSYKVLSDIAAIYGQAFQILQGNTTEEDAIAAIEELKRRLRENKEVRQRIDNFYAVEARLKSEMLNLSMRNKAERLIRDTENFW
ncbi:MAG: hypothetical protein LBQ03_01335 [Puniceicoccales bacterium]|jgi:hypothetical protein|nr:hypothetical protein [Puniceicoccales bacterium]